MSSEHSEVVMTITGVQPVGLHFTFNRRSKYTNSDPCRKCERLKNAHSSTFWKHERNPNLEDFLTDHLLGGMTVSTSLQHTFNAFMGSRQQC